jgi:hypothetical protein
MPARSQPKADTSARGSNVTETARRHGLPIPWVKGVVLNVPPRTWHTMVFGAGLIAFTRVLLAWLTDQSAATMTASYIAAVLLAFTLSKNTKRMAESTPRKFTSSFSVVTLATSGFVPVDPTPASTRYAAATLVLLLSATIFGEVLHRVTGYPEDATAPAEEEADTVPEKPETVAGKAETVTEKAEESVAANSEDTDHVVDSLTRILATATDLDDARRQFINLKQVR